MPTFRIPVWLATWFAVAGASIFLHGPLPLFSTRTLSVAWEMWRLGEWWVPHLNGQAYAHKAPLLYWLIHLGWWITGVGDAWPRILEVLLGGLNLWLCARLARQLFPTDRIAESAPWVLLGCAYFFLFSLQILFELLLMSCVLGWFVALTHRDAQGRIQPLWGWMGACLALGLLSKGPVALLHMLFPLLCAPYWLGEELRARAQWYRRSAWTVLAGIALFMLWALPVAWWGGSAYRHELLLQQTAGRLVASFDHARPVWWYLGILPLLLFPWLFWGSTWSGARHAGRSLRQEPGLRFLLCWLLPCFAVFSLISGKQAYYLLPLLAGTAIAFAFFYHRAPNAEVPMRPVSVALVLVLVGTLTASLPWLASHTTWDPNPFMQDFARGGYGFGALIAVLGLTTLAARAPRAALVRRVAVAALLVAATLHVQFSTTVWHRYDLLPLARQIAAHQGAGRAVAFIGTYEGQFHFLGRLQQPIYGLTGPAQAVEWARAHPNGVLVDYLGPKSPSPPLTPLFRTPFRSGSLLLWDAHAWLLLQPGSVPRAG